MIKKRVIQKLHMPVLFSICVCHLSCSNIGTSFGVRRSMHFCMRCGSHDVPVSCHFIQCTCTILYKLCVDVLQILHYTFCGKALWLNLLFYFAAQDFSIFTSKCFVDRQYQYIHCVLCSCFSRLDFFGMSTSWPGAAPMPTVNITCRDCTYSAKHYRCNLCRFMYAIKVPLNSSFNVLQ